MFEIVSALRKAALYAQYKREEGYDVTLRVGTAGIDVAVQRNLTAHRANFNYEALTWTMDAGRALCDCIDMLIQRHKDAVHQMHNAPSAATLAA